MKTLIKKLQAGLSGNQKKSGVKAAQAVLRQNLPQDKTMKKRTNKSSLTLLLQLLIIHCALLVTTADATIRYVSPHGSNEPPYTSWSTSAHSIQMCIDISEPGDTIYVGNGVYKETIVMIPHLSLIGAGWDSCIVDLTEQTTYVRAVQMKDSCLITGFNIRFAKISPPGIRGVGVYMDFYQDTVKYGVISFNKIDYAETGILVTEGHINHNIFVGNEWGIMCIVSDEQRIYEARIDSNYISFWGMGIHVVNKTRITAVGNTFNLESQLPYHGRIFNNDGLSGSLNPSLSNNNILPSTYNVVFDRAIRSAYPGNFTNNQFLAKFNNVFYTAPSNIKNNNVIGSVNAVYGNTTNVKYNNFWQVSNYPADTTNISVDPMFVNDSSDFRLQMYSPLIDAGDPDILDVDGSRSDIGLYGGPNGMSYQYIDLPPRPPQNVIAVLDTADITIKWNQNIEADFSHYNLYRDTTAGFPADSTTIVMSLSDTFYNHIIPPGINNYYYKLTAVDNQRNESQPSEEIAVNISSMTINDYPMTINDYILYQNYPNPFNPSTKMAYRLKEGGYVKLYVYDVKGELVDILVNQHQDGGYYEVEFNASVGSHQSSFSNLIASGIYLYQIMVKSNNNIPVFTDMKKMIYIK